MPANGRWDLIRRLKLKGRTQAKGVGRKGAEEGICV